MKLLPSPRFESCMDKFYLIDSKKIHFSIIKNKKNGTCQFNYRDDKNNFITEVVYCDLLHRLGTVESIRETYKIIKAMENK